MGVRETNGICKYQPEAAALVHCPGSPNVTTADVKAAAGAPAAPVAAPAAAVPARALLVHLGARRDAAYAIPVPPDAPGDAASEEEQQGVTERIARVEAKMHETISVKPLR